MRLGRYELVEPLGAGGMAEVWRARTVGVAGFQRDVALKVIRDGLGDDPQVVAMFVDEACLSAKLNHPNIVATLDFGFVDGRYFIAFELIDGIDLAAILRREPRGLPLLEALHIAAEVAAALGYAMAAPGDGGEPLGLVHRDVNPSNVLVTTHGQVKLGDFGIAKSPQRAQTTRAGDLKGKLVYMSPEQAWGRPVDARSDVYALGLTLYELLHGKLAIDAYGEIDALEAARHGRLEAISDELPPSVVEVLRTATAYEPEARYQDHASLRAALLLLLEGASIPALQQALAARVAPLLHARSLRQSLAVPRSAATPRPDEPRPDESRPDESRPDEPRTIAEGAATVHATRRRKPALTWVLAAMLVVMAATAVVSVGLLLRAPQKVASIATIAPQPAVAAPVIAPAPMAVVVHHASAPVSSSRGTVRIKVEPWAEVSIDGRAIGMTPLRPFDLPPGRHRLVAKNPSFPTKQASFTVRGGESKLVSVHLAQP
ncbi:MAG: serine/threonine-protein kinase [Polyangia bacterium]